VIGWIPEMLLPKKGVFSRLIPGHQVEGAGDLLVGTLLKEKSVFAVVFGYFVRSGQEMKAGVDGQVRRRRARSAADPLDPMRSSSWGHRELRKKHYWRLLEAC